MSSHLSPPLNLAFEAITSRPGGARIEALRVDHANHILGLRLNLWTSIIIFLAAVIFPVRGRRGQPDVVRAEPSAEDAGRERQVS